jgi:hypothetical protein
MKSLKEMFKSKKSMLPDVPMVDGVIDEIISRLIGGGKGTTMNITINNYVKKEIEKKPKDEEEKEDDENVFVNTKDLKGEKFIKDF